MKNGPPQETSCKTWDENTDVKPHDTAQWREKIVKTRVLSLYSARIEAEAIKYVCIVCLRIEAIQEKSEAKQKRNRWVKRNWIETLKAGSELKEKVGIFLKKEKIHLVVKRQTTEKRWTVSRWRRTASRKGRTVSTDVRREQYRD